MPYVKTRDSVDLYVKDWGQGRPVILVHGWPLNADSWDDQALALAEAGHRVIFYDRRGFGRSGQPFSGYDFDTLADDLAAVIEATGVEDAALFGFSMGGGEVARYMSRHGGKGISQAGLVSAVVPYLLKDETNPDGADPAMFEQIKDQLRKDRAHFLAGFLQDFYGVGYISSPVSQEVLDQSLAWALQGSLAATIQCVDSWSRTDFRPDLPAFTVPTLIVHGTAHSGDLGWRDAAGYITVVDRKKDMIKSGGENVSSREVEEILYRHPAVSEVAVIGLPDPKWIEAVTAVVVSRTDHALTAEDLQQHCRDLLSPFKAPKRYHFVETLPRNASGKILKRDLRIGLAGISS